MHTDIEVVESEQTSCDCVMADSTANSRTRDLDKLLLRPGNLVGPTFGPGTELRDDLEEYAKVLVVGAGGLGCELLKDLALTGFKNLEVMDMDRIEVTYLNRQFLFRLEDVGKPKAEVAAKRVMERVSGVNIVPHFCRIEDKDPDFCNDFSIIALGLDSVEARSFINAVACSFLEYDSEDKPREETIKPMVDGGTEGFKGHAQIIMPGVHSGKAFDPDNLEHMQWVYSEVINWLSSELSFLAFQQLHILSLSYNGVEGLHIKATEFVRDKDCLVCGPGVLIELDTSVTLKQFIDLLEEPPRLHLSKASVTHRGKNLYMQAPPVLEEMTHSNLTQPLFDLMGRIPRDTVHVSGTTSKDDKKTSALRKLRVVFTGVDVFTDMDTAGGA
ncbi:hypothetical protein Ancab_013407 [Ancistrocladus abbreviatus]